MCEILDVHVIIDAFIFVMILRLRIYAKGLLLGGTSLKLHSTIGYLWSVVIFISWYIFSFIVHRIWGWVLLFRWISRDSWRQSFHLLLSKWVVLGHSISKSVFNRVVLSRTWSLMFINLRIRILLLNLSDPADPILLLCIVWASLNLSKESTCCLRWSAFNIIRWYYIWNPYIVYCLGELGIASVGMGFIIKIGRGTGSWYFISTLAK